jgi:hypothetical protein
MEDIFDTSQDAKLLAELCKKVEGMMGWGIALGILETFAITLSVLPFLLLPFVWKEQEAWSALVVGGFLTARVIVCLIRGLALIFSSLKINRFSSTGDIKELIAHQRRLVAISVYFGLSAILYVGFLITLVIFFLLVGLPFLQRGFL